MTSLTTKRRIAHEKITLKTSAQNLVKEPTTQILLTSSTN